MYKEEIGEKFRHLEKVLSSETFIKMESLGGEIPFFISAYNPEQEVGVQKALKGLINKLENTGLKTLEIDIYDLAIKILDEELGDGEVFELEASMDKDEFKSALQSVLDINDVFMPRIKQLIDHSEADMYLITGVGKAYPIIRSHNILNNLQNIAKDAPTVMFFPGRYNGQALELFGKLKDDNYYRAFNIENTKI